MNAGELKRNFELKFSTFLEDIKRDYRFDQRITDGIYHAVSDGGKRLRPVLYLTAFCDALNLSGSDFEREQILTQREQILTLKGTNSYHTTVCAFCTGQAKM